MKHQDRSDPKAHHVFSTPVVAVNTIRSNAETIDRAAAAEGISSDFLSAVAYLEITDGSRKDQSALAVNEDAPSAGSA